MSDLKLKTGLDEIAALFLYSASKAIIHAPVDKIDIPEWLFTLTDVEYQRCSVAHIAGGATRSPDGKRVSINVEMIGPALMVQHWTEDVAENEHSRLVSRSDMFAQQHGAKLQLVWDMVVKPLSVSSCEFTNSLFLYETDDLLAFVESSGGAAAQVRETLQRTIDAHNAEETPNFAESVEKKALSSRLTRFA
jgi:hypothetical protein